jgi:hypothetical protein
MPAKKRKNVISDAERTKRLEETARDLGTSEKPKDFERAFKRIIVLPRSSARKRP